MFKNLVDIERLTKEDILSIIELAKEFKNGKMASEVADKTVAMMFCENSTRTRCSFEIAANKLGMNVVNFDTANSSISKGESLKDTIENLYFLGVDAVVIRHSLSGIIDNIMNYNKYPISFINAGDGNRAHPTQALLDFYTMFEKIGSVKGKTIAIIGDIKHSRVVKSNIALLNKFGMNINLSAPTYFQPAEAFKYPVNWFFCPQDAVKNADIIMVLRVQNERHGKEIYPQSNEYKGSMKLQVSF
jgi:aspartate carbamoyltransferase catalytic subunit